MQDSKVNPTQRTTMDITAIPQQPQSQAPLQDQMNMVRHAAIRLGCYDASDLLEKLAKKTQDPNPTQKWLAHFGCKTTGEVAETPAFQKFLESLRETKTVVGDIYYFFEGELLQILSPLTGVLSFQLIPPGGTPLCTKATTAYKSCQPTTPNPTQTAREKAAQEAFEAHNFGEWEVTDFSGWTRDGRFWSRMVYGDRNQDGEPARFSGSFGVEFEEDSHTIVETWFQD